MNLSSPSYAGVSHFQKRLKVGFSCVAGLWCFLVHTLQKSSRYSEASSACRWQPEVLGTPLLLFFLFFIFFLLWPLLASKAHFFLPLIGGDTRKTLLIFVNSMEEQMHCMYRLGPPNILGGTLASSRHSVH